MSELKSDELMVGNPTEMSINIYNTGKDNLNTFMCDVIGKGIKIENDRKFIGNFNTGTQETFSFTATPTRAGEIEGQIMLSYEDSTGKVHTQTKDFKKEVMEGMPEDMGADMNGEMTHEMGMEDPNMGGGSVLTSPFLWIGLIVILILAGILYKKKKGKKEDEELLIDDED